MLGPDHLGRHPDAPAPASGTAQKAPPVWLRFAVPSITDLILLALLGGFSYGALASKLLGDAGTGWHIRNGEQILATHAVTRVDSFSSLMAGHSWYAWEWVYDIAIAGVHHWAGLNGVVFLTALLIALTFASLFRLSLKRGSGIAVATVLVMLSVFASSIHFFARPHVLSWLFTLLWFEILDSAELSPQARSRLWWFPVITLVWVNIHGGFLLGFVLLCLYLVAGTIGRLKARNSQEQQQFGHWIRQLGGVSLISAAATLVNPYGYKLHAHIYGYLTDRFLMNHIDEFQSPNFHGVAQQCFLILLLITLVSLACIPGKPRLSHLLVIVTASYSGLYASRNLPTSCILLTLIVAPLLSSAIESAPRDGRIIASVRHTLAKFNGFDQRMRSMEQSLRGHLWAVAVIGFGAITCAQHGKLGRYQVFQAQFSPTRFPVQAVNLIEASDIRQPIFTPDYWGGYLIYRLYPHNQVVMDDRHDLYGDERLTDYLKVVNLQSGWENVLNREKVSWILLPKGWALANMLDGMPQWREIYRDSLSVLYQRTEAQNAP